MTTRLLILLLSLTSSVFAQRADQYGQLSFSNASSVEGKLIVLFGNANEQGFLKGLGAAPKKATFICDNIESQATKSFAVNLDQSGKYDFTVSSGPWPVNETLVVCGTVTLKQRYRGDNVDTDFKFAAWGSAMAYAELKAQIPSLQQRFVDFCPQNAYNCDSNQLHPEPELPEYKTTVTGKVGVHDCDNSARVTGGTAEIVFDATEEGRNFNQSTSVNAVCDALPGNLNNIESFALGDIDSDGGYSISPTFKGRGVSGFLYVCAYTSRHKGTILACDDRADNGHVQFRRHVTLNPNITDREDFFYDYTD
jgi:hypothetical protein